MMLSIANLKDYLPALAIVVSIVSFGLSLWTFRFNRHVKSTELRSQLLTKIADVKNSAVNAVDDFYALARSAETNDAEEAERYHALAIRMKSMKDQLAEMYETVANREPAAGLALYQKIFHDVHDVQTQITDLRNVAAVNPTNV